MTNVGAKDDSSRWKPEQYKHYLTLGEVAEIVSRDRSRIRRLESAGRIAAPIRVKVGRIKVRLYSPEEVAIIVTLFKNAKPGRPKRRKR
jgi:hypothetical protein